MGTMEAACRLGHCLRPSSPDAPPDRLLQMIHVTLRDEEDWSFLVLHQTERNL
ncbi:hypothetical protein AXF42_Ash006166 [Apostasia shenzhenica]|uniref:Uncharacterized protein n=1 Tax=Apostasia shenzhenica TaxID=1088818 RepID=A0A2I0B0H3_9ASPA|nr:hypothetical protein AXF42_Ash006166 [Apostasia shenzhenica]